MLSRMLPAFDLGIGGRMGSGSQWMSCITRADLIRLIAHAIVTPSLNGPVNATAPEPCKNRDFAKSLARALRRPAIVPLPAFILTWLGGDLAKELMLTSQRVVPAKALASGFVFDAPEIDAMLEKIATRPTASTAQQSTYLQLSQTPMIH
jgi:uncharacterized protein